MAQDQLQIEVRPEDGGAALLFTLRGALDFATAPTLRAAMSQAQDDHHNVVVDLTQVEFLDSTGLGALIGGHKRAAERDGSLRLIVNDGPILRLLAITGLIRALPVYHSVGDAIGDQARVTVAP